MGLFSFKKREPVKPKDEAVTEAMNMMRNPDNLPEPVRKFKHEFRRRWEEKKMNLFEIQLYCCCAYNQAVLGMECLDRKMKIETDHYWWFKNQGYVKPIVESGGSSAVNQRK